MRLEIVALTVLIHAFQVSCEVLGDCPKQIPPDGHVTVSDGATAIGNEAFKGCTKLASISIPASVESIGSYAFKDAAAKICYI